MKDLLITLTALLVPFVIPCLTIWSHPNWKGVLIAGLTLWVFLGMGELYLLGRYDTGGPAGAVFALWLLFGLPLSLIGFGIVAWARRKTQKLPASSPEPAHSAVRL